MAFTVRSAEERRMPYYIKIIRDRGTVTWLRGAREVLAPGAATKFKDSTTAWPIAKAYEKSLASPSVHCIITNIKDLE